MRYIGNRARRFLWAVLAFCWGVAILFPLTGAASHPSTGGERAEVAIFLNGQPLELAVKPVLRGGRAYVPLRGLFERLGATVAYDAAAGKVTIVRGATQVEIQLADGSALRNGKPLVVDKPPFVADGHTYVPVRFVAEALGDHVDWLADRQAVIVWSAYARQVRQDAVAAAVTPAEPSPAGTPKVPYSDEELELLARVINAEAYGQPFEGQVAVGAVVVNRVLHPSFPDSIKAVIQQRGQFKVIENGQVDRPVTESAYRAARAALYGSDPSQGALFFYNPETVQSDFLLRRTITVRIGDHVFAR